jgi:hypothetical protein
MKLVDHIKAFRAWAERRGSAIERSSPAHDAIDFAEKFGLTTREYHRLHYLMEEAKDGRWPDAWRPSTLAGERTLFNSRLQPARWWVGQREDGSWELQKARSAMRFPWINVVGPYPSKKVAQRAMRAANIKERLKPKKFRMLFNPKYRWYPVGRSEIYASPKKAVLMVVPIESRWLWKVMNRETADTLKEGIVDTREQAKMTAQAYYETRFLRMLFNPRARKYKYRWYPGKGRFWAELGDYFIMMEPERAPGASGRAAIRWWKWFLYRRHDEKIMARGFGNSIPEAKRDAEREVPHFLPPKHPEMLFNPEQSILPQGKIVIEWRAPTSRHPALYEWRVYLLTTFTHGEHAGQRGFWGPAASGLARTRAQARAEAKKAYSRLVRKKPRMLFNPNIMTMPRGEIRVEGVLRGRRGRRRCVYLWHVFLRGQKAPVAAGVSASHMKAYERGQEAYEEAVRRTPRMMF